MSKPKVVVLSLLCAAAAAAPFLSGAQPAGFKRTPVQRADLSVPGREVVQAVAELPVGMSVGRHTHAGEEVSYVLEGTVLLLIDGQPPREVKAGEGFTVPAGVIHDAKVAGDKGSKVLATYIVEKGKPLATPAP
jgi:quercetin dioxygenase-like cupin family protein